jgi:hypothetical protein
MLYDISRKAMALFFCTYQRANMSPLAASRICAALARSRNSSVVIFMVREPSIQGGWLAPPR